MNAPILEQTAADVMSRDLVLIPRSMTVKAAAQLLWERRISGAPVVDEQERCIGVLSSTDFVRCAMQEMPAAADDYFTDWSLDEHLDGLPDHPVERIMTPDPVTVPASVPVAELARRMVDAHVHRLIVADEHGRPRGVVSSMDLLGVLARAVPAPACC